jgi:surface antigen
MTNRFLAAALALSAATIAPASADPIADLGGVGGGGSASLPPYLQCVPYARQVSGIRIFGDAHTWWGQAEGHYARGTRPRVGAVMSFRPHGNMRLGHVAAVSRIVDARTVLVRHANWSLINGRRGQIEDNVRVIDVSSNNDWSEVRVWFAPLGALGGTHWPLNGFIYNQSGGREPAPRSAGRTSNDPIGDIIAARLGR